MSARPQVVGGSARSRAQHWGKLVKSMDYDGASGRVYREVRRKPDGSLTLIEIEGSVLHYWTGLRHSEAALMIVRWDK